MIRLDYMSLIAYFARRWVIADLIICTLIVFPASVFADGSQSYTTPGTYTFTVPTYDTLTIQAWGGGAGGLGFGAGSDGENSSFAPSSLLAPTAGGGQIYGTGGATDGPGGAAQNGAVNESGGNGDTTGGGSSPNGGSGGQSNESSGVAGNAPGGGGGGGGYGMNGSYSETRDGGGGGAYTSMTYSYGQLMPGSLVTVMVGSGGAGGNGGAACLYRNLQDCQFYGYFDGSPGGPGAPGEVLITWTSPPPPSCSVTISPNPSAYAYSGTPVTVSWTSTNATQVYINNIGWVGTSGSTQVASQSSTNYSCYGYSSSYGDGSWDTIDTTLTVTPPASPTATIAASSTSIYAGQLDNVTATFTAGSGDALTADNIDSPVGTGLSADTNPDASKTISFSTTTPGTYTFYARATTDYYASWQTLASTTVSVTQPPASCTPSTQYICTGSGNETITASSADAYCDNTQTTIATCVAPQFCQSGSSSCLYPAISFNQSGDYTGNLQLVPDIVKPDETTQVHWSVSDAQSCTVTGTNGDSWIGLASPADGETSSPINSQTIYTLSCEAYGTNSNLTETQTVDVAPIFKEI